MSLILKQNPHSFAANKFQGRNLPRGALAANEAMEVVMRKRYVFLIMVAFYLLALIGTVLTVQTWVAAG